MYDQRNIAKPRRSGQKTYKPRTPTTYSKPPQSVNQMQNTMFKNGKESGEGGSHELRKR
jgi:hypothetical protein